jgi:hypothetical protein
MGLAPEEVCELSQGCGFGATAAGCGLEPEFGLSVVFVCVLAGVAAGFFLGFLAGGVVQTGVGGGAGHLNEACF